MARSEKYKIQVEFYDGRGYDDDYWNVYVWECKWLIFGNYVGSRKVYTKPLPSAMEQIGREIIDEFLAKKDREQKEVVYVRHP